MADLVENPLDFGSNGIEFGVVKNTYEVGNEEVCGKTQAVEDLNGHKFCGGVGALEGTGQEEGKTGVVKKSIEMGNDDGFCKINKAVGAPDGDGLSRKSADYGCFVEEEMAKVTLDGSNRPTSLDVNTEGTEVGSGHEAELKSGNIISDDGNKIQTSGGGGGGVNDDDDKDDDDESGLETESQSSSSSSASSSSSSSDNEDEEEEVILSAEYEKKLDNEDGAADGNLDVEEGEIMLSDADEMVAWSGGEEDDDVGSGMAGPIRSKNEVMALPPVPSVNVTLQPHHQMLSLGIISSILGAQVIVEGVENHNPLNEGSILWITESRSALGIVDEIFGPVKNPYYIVRYNSEMEVPPDILQGTLISFVPEFANHVLHEKNLYQKGYDASGENDEEISDDLEFSDDEQEAEYRRMVKMKKRGINDLKLGKKKRDKKQFKNQSGNGNRDQVASGKVSVGDNKLLVNQDQHLVQPHVAASSDQDSGLAGGRAVFPPFAPTAQAPTFCPPSGNWTNGFHCQQPQTMSFPTGLTGNGIQWLPQAHPQQLYQMPLPTGLPLQHQSNPIFRLPLNFVLSGGQANINGGPSFTPWMGQNVLNQSPFGIGLQDQQPPLPVNVEGQARPNMPQFGIDPNLQPSPVTSGRPNSRGFESARRNGHQNTRGRFGRGRGRASGR